MRAAVDAMVAGRLGTRLAGRLGVRQGRHVGVIRARVDSVCHYGAVASSGAQVGVWG